MSTSLSQRTDREQITRRAQALIKVVRKSLNSPAQRAALRRGVGRPPEHVTARTTHAVVAPFLPEGADRATEWAFYAVATLIAAQPRQARDADLNGHNGTEDSPPNAPADGTGEPVSGNAEPASKPSDASGDAPPRRRLNLGRTLASAVLTGKVAENTTEARLHLLCRQDLAGVHRHLPRLIAHLRADLVAVDWVVLAEDLARWDIERDRVAKEWLQSFHRTLASSRNADATPSTTSESERS